MSAPVDLALQLVALVACAVLLIKVEPMLNHATRNTPWRLWLALWLLAVGALLLGAAIIPAGLCSPWPGAAALASGGALYVMSERRRGEHEPIR